MPDREKVIKEWESVLSRDPLDAPWDLIDDTLTLLKEQEEILQSILREKNNELNSRTTALQIETQNREVRRLLE